ncbi:MAG: zinc ribbon domain-containing protein [Clostridia bacterium]|nr:zinc ribbon domain-containing protein [Clostridia bacterium]
MKICPNCFKQFNDDAVFCDNCGTKLAVPVATPQNKPVTPPVHPPVAEPGKPYEEHVEYYPPLPPENGGGNTPAKKNNKTGMIIGIVVAAVVLLAAIGAGVYFLFISDKSPLDKNKDDAVFEEQTYVEVVPTTKEPEATSSVIVETTTASFTSPAPEVVPTDKIYITFFNFYISYLDGINALNPGAVAFCSDEVKAEMVERFQYNKKSLFDLCRIDFDMDSYTVTPNGISNEYSFYVKCVTRMYYRDTLEEKELNYAVWKVTVTETNGDCIVSHMERDDDYKMSTNVEVMDDNSSIF